jgi:hypothetical protein
MHGLRPPNCPVCHRTLSDFPRREGVSRDYFTPICSGETEREKSGSAQPESWAGRRGNAVRFCHDHVAIARERENGHWGDALAALRHNARSCRKAGVACSHAYSLACMSVSGGDRQLSRALRTEGRAKRRIGIRQFSIAGRDIGAQIVRLCAGFRVSGWLFVPRVARGLWGVVAAAGRPQAGLREGACCYNDHCPGGAMDSVTA